MNIALVGFTNSYNDQQWLQMARAWAAKHDPQLPWTHATRHVFDLRGERASNFLDDDGLYDVVILFAIYNPPTPAIDLQKSQRRQRGQTSLAINHSRDNWVERLSRTKAKYLFIFRRPDSVTGEWLGQINHYEKDPEQPGVFGVSIYRREMVKAVIGTSPL